MFNNYMCFLGGFLLDMLLGDPYCLPHPIRIIGNFISFLEKRLLNLDKRNNKKELINGMVLVLLVVGFTGVISYLILFLAYKFNFWLGMVLETLMCYYIFAAKSLKTESMKVYNKLKSGTIEEARYAVSMIVGRDTSCLDKIGVSKAAIETVAENTSDGVIAPMFFTALGGPVVGFMYKAVNTMDSMVGYKNDKYIYFGRFAARLDDVLNFIPARLSAWLMIICCFFAGKDFNIKNAIKIYIRDRNKPSSPNAGHTEAVCAGALGIQLGGDAVYFGKIHKKPFLGDFLREVNFEDIKLINKLMYISAWVFLILVAAIKMIFI